MHCDDPPDGEFSKRNTTHTSTGNRGGISGRARTGFGSFYLIGGLEVDARTPALSQQPRLFGEVDRNEFGGRLDPPRLRSCRVRDLELEAVLVVGCATDLANQEIGVLLEEPDHVRRESKESASRDGSKTRQNE